MRDDIFHLKADPDATLHGQLREMLVSAILDGQMPGNSPLPSSRRMASLLGVARNTVVHAYQELVTDGFLIARPRSGYYVNPDILEGLVRPKRTAPPRKGTVDWHDHLKRWPNSQPNVVKPANWQDFPYPFLCGQFDPALFPLADWRECSRLAHSVQAVREWAGDAITADDPDLVEQIRTRLLPRRGIRVHADEILVTVGALQALYIVSSLLIDGATTVGVENPGYPDARNIFALRTQRLRPIPVDRAGLVPGPALAGCGLVYTTPSHQYPTTVTMPLERRTALLEAAQRHNLILIEDEYESEFNYTGPPSPALKSLDEAGRVIFVSSVSKTLAPGLRLGFMVAPPAFIAEARALRRLMVRHPPGNTQRTIALLLSRGSHDAQIRRLSHVYKERWQTMSAALARYLPTCTFQQAQGGTAFWVSGPPGLDADDLAVRARAEGVLIEPGTIDFMGAEFSDDARPRNHFRMGFSSIPTQRIEPGLEILGRLVAAGAR